MLGTKGLEFTKKEVHRTWGFNFFNLKLNKLVILYVRCFSLSVPGFHETLFRHRTFEQETAFDALTYVSKVIFNFAVQLIQTFVIVDNVKKACSFNWKNIYLLPLHDEISPTAQK